MSNYEENPCPKISYADNFKKWIKTVDEQSIQSWTTRDWLKMYDKIEDCIQNSLLHKGFIWEKYHKKWKAHQISDEELKKLSSRLDSTQFLRNEFVVECEEEFVKIYKNYRISPEQYSAMMKKGKEIGQHLALRGDIDCAAIAFERNSRAETMNNINVVMLKEAYDIDNPNEFEQFLAKIQITDRTNVSSSGINGIEIDGSIYDSSLKTMGHEGTHYYFQTTAKWMKEQLEQGTTAKDIPYDFAMLLKMNSAYYLSSVSKKDISALDKEEQRKYQDKAFESYRKQPVEKHANIMGLMIEHTYRNCVNQYSEKNSLKLYPYIEDTLGTPYKTTHNGKSVTFEHHKTPYLGVKQIQKSFAGLPQEMIEAMNIRETKDSLAYDIPENWSASKEIEKFLDLKDKEPPSCPPVWQAIQQKPVSDR